MTTTRPPARPARPKRAARPAETPAGVHLRVAIPDPHRHLFALTLTIHHPSARQRVSLPVWIPGSYLVREFSQHLQNLQATQGGQAVAVRQLDKHSWQIDAQAGQPLELRYEVYAFDASVRTAFLDATRGFFNSTSLCLRVAGQTAQPHTLTLAADDLPAGWRVATGLSPEQADADGRGRYRAADYDELADCPVELGTFWQGDFEACGVPHRFVVSGAGAGFDGERLLADTRRLCEAQIRFWHGDQAPPFTHYVFMLHASADGYGGLEHRNSTALICQRADLPPRSAAARATTPLKAADGYTTLLGLISHEYFHTWNVKRLRPAEFAPYDYAHENYTELLWFFEGFTSYYDDLFLRRAGLIDNLAYLQLVTKTANQVLQTPGRHLQSVAQASFDAWIKYYRVGENTPNATVSYYTKGALVALCLDLTLRAAGTGSLDDVMRHLWAACAGGPVREADIARALRAVGGRSFARELRDWVHGTDDLPLTELLRAQGASVDRDKAPLAQQLGLRVSESGGITIKTVLRGGAAEAAGLAAGDEWLGIEIPPPRRGQPAEAWQIRKLDELPLLLGARRRCTAIVARDRRLLRCELVWPEEPVQALRVGPADAQRLQAWLAP
ncbi:M61 family metallopeptidase [Hydrogenophaga electricum]|uniref:Peptidase n=1 Tax=Hydrogenophaga electricum TaxID=1230953 RepID=A0ABQ6C759_9BURK|nr:peptidase M61 [Hydrogenophaga electricum]GLS15458.1 peptidase [Hydrogenophaga electricum]